MENSFRVRMYYDFQCRFATVKCMYEGELISSGTAPDVPYIFRGKNVDEIASSSTLFARLGKIESIRMQLENGMSKMEK